MTRYKVVTIRKTAIFCLTLFAVCLAGNGFAGDRVDDAKKGKVSVWTKDHKVDTGSDKDRNKSGRKEIVRMSGMGTVDRFDKKEKVIVIDDGELHLASKVSYFKKKGQRGQASDIKKGEIVGFVLNPDGKIGKLYIMEEPKL